MALFGMLWIVVSSWWVRAEDAQPCPKGYYCPEQTRALDQPSTFTQEFQTRRAHNLDPAW